MQYCCRLVKPQMELKPKLPTKTPYGAHMDIGQYGDLNTLCWVENEFDSEPNMVHCEVIYGESLITNPCVDSHVLASSSAVP
jgi:hypothetical protein